MDSKDSVRPQTLLICGGLLGLAALALDEVAVKLTIGYWVPISWRLAVIYALVGLLVAWAVLGLSRLLKPQANIGLTECAAWTAVGLYLPSLAERIHYALLARTQVWGWVLLLVLMGGVCGIGVWGVGRVLGRAHRPWAGFLVAMAAAAGLAINRNLVASPVEPLAVALDAGVLMAIALFAISLRRFGAVKAWGALAALLGIALLSTGGWGSTQSKGGTAATERAPNLVLVMIDTLRQDVFQDVVAKAPEGLAFKEALSGAAWFSNAFVAAPWTAPSMGSIMTGLYPREHGLIKPSTRRDLAAFTRLSDEIPTLAEKLGRRGYQTSAVVANPILHPQSGISRGFDRYEVLAGPTVKLPLLTVLSRAGLLGREFYQGAGWVRHRLAHELKQIETDRPVFLWLHLMDPHDPLYEHELETESSETAGSLSDLERLYRREVRYTLAQLTVMLDMMKEKGLWQNTVFMVASDHGEMFPSDGRNTTGHPSVRKLLGHGHALYDELSRAALVIRPLGGLPQSRELDVLTHHTDLHDTVIDLLGLDMRRIGRDRVSLMPWLQPEPAPVDQPSRESVMIEATHSGPEQRALRTKRWKVIQRPQGQSPPELYELTVDPSEQVELSTIHPEQTERLVLRLTDFWHGLEDPPITEAQDLDEETRRQLEALGYL